jgi:hypothetical protein
MKTVDYSKTTTPKDYKCANCGATGCKLWREYQTSSPQLLCVDCAAKEEGKDITSMDERGFRDIGQGLRGKTNQIGWYVPAVPDEEGIGYWGYTSVPEAGVKWWERLPLRPTAATTA